MKFSEAMILGSTQLRSKPHIRNDQRGGGCAVGMAEISVGITQSACRGKCAETVWPWLGNHGDYPCGCYRECREAVCRIVHLFNEHVHGNCDWTLEQLVDYVRSIEPAENEPCEDDEISDVRPELEVYKGR